MRWREEMTHKGASGLAKGGERITYADVGAARSRVRTNDVDQTDIGAKRSAGVTDSPFLSLIFCDDPNGFLAVFVFRTKGTASLRGTAQYLGVPSRRPLAFTLSSE